MLAFLASKFIKPQEWQFQNLNLLMDVVLLAPSDEQIGKLYLYMPWIHRIHIIQTDYAKEDEKDELPNGMSSENRIVRSKIPFHEYCLMAPYLAEHFILVRNWTPSQFLFAFDFFKDGKPILRRHRTDIVAFTRTGFNHGFFYLPRAMSSDLRNYENKALEKMQQAKKVCFAKHDLPSSDVDWKQVYECMDKSQAIRVVLLKKTNDAHILFGVNTCYVLLEPYDTKLQFLKRTIVKRARSIDATHRKTVVEIVLKIKEVIGNVDCEVYGDINDVQCTEISDVMSTKLLPLPKVNTNQALCELLSQL